MGIVSVAEKADGTRSGAIDKSWARTYTRQFVVETSGPAVGPLAVRSASGIPQPGTFYTNGLAESDPDYEWDAGAFVTSVEASMDSGSGGIQWTVTVNYGPYDANEFSGDPTTWKIKVTIGGEHTEKVLYFDQDGVPVRNSAGDPFDPPFALDDSRSTLTVTRNELVSTFDLTLAELMRDGINQNAWNGFDAHTVKCGIITTSDPQYDSFNQRWYYTVTYPYTINRDGWKVKLLDAGCNELNEAEDAAIPIMNGGQQVSDPVPLDGTGHRLPVGETPVTLEFNGYKVVDYDIFNLDLDDRLGA